MLNWFFILIYNDISFSINSGLVITHTNELPETMLLQLSSGNNYYASGEHDSISITIGSRKILLLYYTCHIDRNISQIIQ